MQEVLKHFKPPCLLPRQRRTLWTQGHMVRPALVKRKFGNGRRLVAIAPILHRPHYYLVWVDDGWDLNNSDEWLDQLDGIWEAIADEFGSRDSESERRYEWPEEDSEGGCAWWRATLDDIATPRGRRRLMFSNALAQGREPHRGEASPGAMGSAAEETRK